MLNIFEKEIRTNLSYTNCASYIYEFQGDDGYIVPHLTDENCLYRRLNQLSDRRINKCTN